MKLTQKVYDELRKEFPSEGRSTVAAVLREQGYKFSNGHLRELIRQAKAGSPPQAVEPKAVDARPIAGGIIVAPDAIRKRLLGRRFVVTAAQNNTYVHSDFWATLRAFAERKGAQILVGKISYNKGAYSGITRDGQSDGDTAVWYDPELEPYFIGEQVKIAPRLVVAAELDIIPTAINPLGGLDDYTGPNSGIVPHTRLAMKSYATMKHEPPKFMYTTGAVTQRNYIDRRQGQLASFHHVYGALYVEVDEDGGWFVRQINAADDGSFFEVDGFYNGGEKTSGSIPRVAVLGDIHIEKGDPVALGTAITLISETQPENVVLHDLIDFTNRNHHNIKDPHFLAKMMALGDDKVEAAFAKAAKFIKTIQIVNPRGYVIVVKSNHDEAYDRWVRDGSGYPDAANAKFWHESNAFVYQKIEQGVKDIKLFEWAIGRYLAMENVNTDRVLFLQADESFVIDNIEYGMHGHLGVNGAKGGARAFRQMGRRSTTAHGHTAGIVDGNHQVGVLGKLDMGYNRGLSSWSNTNGLTWPNGKRTLITQVGHRWRGKEL